MIDEAYDHVVGRASRDVSGSMRSRVGRSRSLCRPPDGSRRLVRYDAAGSGPDPVRSNSSARTGRWAPPSAPGGPVWTRGVGYPGAFADRVSSRGHTSACRRNAYSWIVLTGHYAYKIKKPVHYDFLDARTLDQRRELCAEELRLNKRLAPHLYLDVLPVTRERGELHSRRQAGRRSSTRCACMNSIQPRSWQVSSTPAP